MELYLDLLKKVLTDVHRMEKGEYRPLTQGTLTWKQKFLLPFDKLLKRYNYSICKYIVPNVAARTAGIDWPASAETMIGLKRLDNIQFCIEQIIINGIAGDLIETGVWRGGAVIFMRAVLKVHGVTDRVVWAADSFEGLPKPDASRYVHDKGDTHHLYQILKVSLEEVNHNFKKYDLLDEQVKFIKGWFRDSLPKAPIERLALLRLDGDMYESTMDALVNLYPKLSIGGYLIVDDFNTIEACRAAVEEFRTNNRIKDEIMPIDDAGIYWKKGEHRMSGI
jgi:hypothetical protein